MTELTDIRMASRVQGLADDHSAVLDAHDELLADLRSAPELRVEERDGFTDGGKGALVELFIGLSSAGSIAAFARIVRLWLGRDRHRSLTVSIPNSDGQVITIEGENISVDTLTEALDALRTVTHEGADGPVSGDNQPAPPA